MCSERRFTINRSPPFSAILLDTQHIYSIIVKRGASGNLCPVPSTMKTKSLVRLFRLTFGSAIFAALATIGPSTLRGAFADSVIVQPLSVSSGWGGASAYTDLIDQTSTFTSGFTTVATVGDASINPVGNQFAASDHFGCIFDLGKVYPITGMAVWQGSIFYLTALWNTYLDLSLDGSSWTSAGRFYFSGQGQPEFAQILETQARYIRLPYTENHGNGRSTYIKEIAFTAIPEPATAAVLTGIAALLVASAWRRFFRA
jgi:hypothetical protein